MKTMKGWEEHAVVTGDRGLDSYLKPGDFVGQDMVDYFANLVPPALMRESLFQVGTPYDSQPGSDGQLRPTFGTFSKEAGEWRFSGYCFFGETVEPARDPSLLPFEGGSRPEFDYVTSYGQLERVALDVGVYENGGLCVAMESFDRDMGERVRFADMTMDVGKTLPPLTVAIDIDTHGDEVVEFLTDNGFGELTGEMLTEGELAQPLFRFDETKLSEADPQGFEQYCKNVGIEVKPKEHEANMESLDDLKGRAKSRAQAQKKSVERPDNHASKNHDTER